jgi:hypothetical protein
MSSGSEVSSDEDSEDESATQGREKRVRQDDSSSSEDEAAQWRGKFLRQPVEEQSKEKKIVHPRNGAPEEESEDEAPAAAPVIMQRLEPLHPIDSRIQTIYQEYYHGNLDKKSIVELLPTQRSLWRSSPQMKKEFWLRHQVVMMVKSKLKGKTGSHEILKVIRDLEAKRSNLKPPTIHKLILEWNNETLAKMLGLENVYPDGDARRPLDFSDMTDEEEEVKENAASEDEKESEKVEEKEDPEDSGGEEENEDDEESEEDDASVESGGEEDEEEGDSENSESEDDETSAEEDKEIEKEEDSESSKSEDEEEKELNRLTEW